MTNAEAIKQLEQVAHICTTTALAEACLMGARAIERDDGTDYLRGKADGIRECRERVRAVLGGDEHGTD